MTVPTAPRPFPSAELAASVIVAVGLLQLSLHIRLAALFGIAFDLGLIATGALLFAKRVSALSLFAALLWLSSLRALYEFGPNFDQIAQRLGILVLLGIVLVMPSTRCSLRSTWAPHPLATLYASLAFALLTGVTSLPWHPHPLNVSANRGPAIAEQPVKANDAAPATPGASMLASSPQGRCTLHPVLGSTQNRAAFDEASLISAQAWPSSDACGTLPSNPDH